MTQTADKMEAIMAYLKGIVRTGYVPASIREIQAATGISSTSVVDYYLDKLVEQGRIERTKHKANSIRILETANEEAE